jgi:RIO-like serine/threonine protein kinase
MTNHDLDVLRALARLSRMRKTVDCDALALRSGGSLDEVRVSLGRLARAALVERTDAGARLTMMGLAIAVASARRAPAPRREAPRARAPHAARRRAA